MLQTSMPRPSDCGLTTQPRSIIMKCLTDAQAKTGTLPDHEITEEQFFEQFAAIEDGLALLQLQMRGMYENVKLFGSLTTRMRRSTCPATLSPRYDA